MTSMHLPNQALWRASKVACQAWNTGGVTIIVDARSLDMDRIFSDMRSGCAKSGVTATFHMLQVLVRKYNLPWFTINSNRKLMWKRLLQYDNKAQWGPLLNEYLKNDAASARMQGFIGVPLTPFKIANEMEVCQLRTKEFGTISKLREYVTSKYTNERWYKDRVESAITEIKRAESFTLTGDKYRE